MSIAQLVLGCRIDTKQSPAVINLSGINFVKKKKKKHSCLYIKDIGVQVLGEVIKKCRNLEKLLIIIIFFLPFFRSFLDLLFMICEVI